MRVVHSLALLAALAVPTAAMADTVTWADWSANSAAGNSGSGQTSVTGTLTGLGAGVTVTYTGQLNGVTHEPSWNNGSYQGGTVSNAPPQFNYSIIEGITGGGSQTETFTFSQSVHNPTMAFWSIGNSGQPISLDFTNDEPFTIEGCGTGSEYGGGCITKDGNNVDGTEGNGVIQFTGDFTSLTFTVPSSEFYYALQVGAPSLTPPVTPPAVPEPSSLALFGTGVLSVAGFARRKFNRS